MKNTNLMYNKKNLREIELNIRNLYNKFLKYLQYILNSLKLTENYFFDKSSFLVSFYFSLFYFSMIRQIL